MKTVITDKITIGDIKKWIAKSKSIHGLQSIRAKTNKRISSLVNKDNNPNPFGHIPIEKKRRVIAKHLRLLYAQPI